MLQHRNWLGGWKNKLSILPSQVDLIAVEVSDHLTHDAVFLVIECAERRLAVEEDDDGFETLAEWVEEHFGRGEEDWRPTAEEHIVETPLHPARFVIWEKSADTSPEPERTAGKNAESG